MAYRMVDANCDEFRSAVMDLKKLEEAATEQFNKHNLIG